MLALQMAERAWAREVVGVIGAAVGAVLHVVKGDVALVADGAGAAVAISAVDRSWVVGGISTRRVEISISL